MSEAAEPDSPADTHTSDDRSSRFDEALSGLDDLAGRPVGEHHDRLAEVHEALHAALHEPPPAS